MNGDSSAILIVDDEVDACQNMADILGDCGYRVDVAHNGFSALDLVRTHTYDIALRDLRMPGTDGLTLYRKIKKLSAGTVAIIVTAYAAQGTANDALAAGVMEVLPKPVDFPKLMGILKQALKRPLILIVDDDVELCDNLWDLFNDHGYRLCVAHDEREAEARLQTREYDVALIDMKLPQGNGLGVYQKVRQASPQAHIIAITGYRSETESLVQQIAADETSVVCYKPFDVSDLLKTLEGLAPSRESD